jgi:hypothetical protein
MLLIRNAQWNAFRAAAQSAFVEEMTTHLTGFAPEVCRTLGRERLRAAVEGGVTRAGGYGFTYRGPIRLFLESMFILGSGFDDDPQYPWARETLRREDFPNQMFKAGRLEHLLRKYLTTVNGSKNELSRRALLELEAFAERPDLAFYAASLRWDILTTFGKIFPSKLHYIGRAAAEALIEHAEALSFEVFGVVEPRSTAVMAILGFSFGAHFAHDPLLPWIGATLTDARIENAAKRAARLERRAVIWLKAVNKNHGAARGAVVRGET